MDRSVHMMTSVRRQDTGFTSLSDAPCLTRLTYNVGTTLLGSVAAATIALTLRAPATGHSAAAFRSAIMNLAPVAAGAASIYTIVACMSRDARGTDDWKNPFYGGAAAGSVVVALKRRTVPAALAGALFLGASAASPYWYNVMSPTIEETTRHRVNQPATAATPQHYAATSQASSSLQRRLL